MGNRVHIIGAGLSGLSCAVHTLKNGLTPILYEAAPKAGGRIREIQNEYDNGTHLIIGAYRDTFEYLDLIGTREKLEKFAPPSYQFFEPESRLSWRVRGRHIAAELLRGRVPDMGWADFKTLISILLSKDSETLGYFLNEQSKSYQRFWEPLLLGIFNTSVKDIPTRAFKNIVWEIIKAGPDALVPYLSKETLYKTFISPALEKIEIQYGKRVAGITAIDGKIEHLEFASGGKLELLGDAVVFAIPEQNYAQVLGETLRNTYNPIGNIHFFVDEKLPSQFFALIGTKAQWVRVHNKIVSVTVSNDLITSEEIDEIWQEVSSFLKTSNVTFTSYKIINEKKATPDQGMKFSTQRLNIHERYANLFVAGDWTDDTLPATIESGIRSGKRAALKACKYHRTKK